MAEFENDIRKARQREGIEKAKQRGVEFGRKAKLDDMQVQELREKREQGILIKDLMKEYGLSKATVYRLMKDETF